jgi:osmotically inducible protein OsmC
MFIGSPAEYQSGDTMPVRTSEATWKGDLRTGSGDMTVGDGLYQGAYSFASRFQEGEGTNPEELIAAAHAGCFAMALSNGLAEDGFDPQRVQASASVHLEDGEINRIDLETEAEVPDIAEATFQEAAEEAKETCPVSQALAAVPEMTLSATLN